MAIALPVVALVSISVIRLVPSSTKPVAVMIPVAVACSTVNCLLTVSLVEATAPTVISGEPANPLAVPVSVPVTLPVRLPEKVVEVVTPVTIAPLLNVGALLSSLSTIVSTYNFDMLVLYSSLFSYLSSIRLCTI